MRKSTIGFMCLMATLGVVLLIGCGQEVVTMPSVVSSTPANGATNVAVNTAITATFSSAMSPSTLTGTTFTVSAPGGAVAGSVSYSGQIATFTPTASLAYSTLYTATITNGVTNLGGTHTASNYVWTFTTITPPPLVISTVPAPLATNVPITQVLTATFNEAMAPATISGSTFKVTGPGGVAVAGTVTYAGVVATFTPTLPLSNTTVYTATITTGVTSLAGTPLAVAYVWTFTTITPPPLVMSTVPAPLATNVPITQVLTATFNEAMAPATISGTTFTVTGPGGVAVAGSVAYAGVVASFTPTLPLANSTVYTATITTGVTSLAGTPLAVAYVWTFTTITPVPFVVSTIPAPLATNVPITQVLTATFNEAMAPATISTSTFTLTPAVGASVTGTVTYSGLVATFTPSANLANNMVYTATITTGATSLAGTPMAANYVWTFTTITPPPAVVATIPANNATGVAISQPINATFNEAMNCTSLSSPATTFTLAGPGVTAVAGTVSCAGAVATFTPTAALLVNTIYTATITTGAQSLAGTPMGANYLWVFRTVSTPMTPMVISTVPANLATSVPINQAVSATFNVAMSPATINTTNFTLSVTGGAGVTGVVTYIPAGSIATFTPVLSLAPNTQYTATVFTGAKDIQGNALAANYSWTFTTASVPLVVLPVVTSTIPANGATNVPINQTVSATFSEAMNPATINSTTFKLTGPGVTPVTGLVAYSALSKSLTFTPVLNLPSNTVFTATINTGATALTGSALATNYVWQFTTGSTMATLPPQILSTVPTNGAINVGLNQAISATFTAPMNPLTITSGTFQVTGPGGVAVLGVVSYDAVNNIATLTPTSQLAPITSYSANITSGATDMQGNSLGNSGAPNPWIFTTGSTIVSQPVVLGPTVALFGSFGGGAGITNQGIHTVVNGSIGTTGASSIVTGFHDTTVNVGGVYYCTYTETTLNLGQVNGTIDTAAGSVQPTAACPNEGTAVTFAIATQVALEATAAYNTLANIPGGLDVSLCPGCGGGGPGELGNRILASGVYKSAPGSFAITAGDLTLDAKGDPNASWVFQMSSSLTVGTPTSPQSIILINGAKAANVYWAVGGLPGAVINYGGGGTMVGTIISMPGITISSPGQSTSSTVTTLNGRVLALNASVTMVNTVINVP